MQDENHAKDASYQEAVICMANHANVIDLDGEYLSRSLIFRLWSSDRANVAPELGKLIDDVVTQLEVINQYLNDGPVPNNCQRPLDRELVSMISSLLTSAMEYYMKWRRESKFDENVYYELCVGIWRISNAWQAVLSGDFDSLQENNDFDMTAKGI
jgi:hypothetical protein